jgi:hypothetical protein
MTPSLPSPFRAALAAAAVAGVLAAAPRPAEAMPVAAPLATAAGSIQPVQYYYAPPPPRYYGPPRGYYYGHRHWRRPPPPVYYAPPPPPPRYYAPPPGVGLYYRY